MYSTVPRKQSVAEKPQNVSPLNFSFQDDLMAVKPIQEKPRKDQKADFLKAYCTARGLSAQKKLMSPEQGTQN